MQSVCRLLQVESKTNLEVRILKLEVNTNEMKKLLLVILSIFLIQIGTYFLIGKDSLPLEVAKNRRTLAGEFTENLYFSFQPKLSELDSQSIKSYFENELNHKVTTSKEGNEDKRMCEYEVEIKRSFYIGFVKCEFYFLYIVDYSNTCYRVANGGAFCMEEFKSKYIWILFKWFKLQDECTAEY